MLLESSLKVQQMYFGSRCKNLMTYLASQICSTSIARVNFLRSYLCAPWEVDIPPLGKWLDCLHMGRVIRQRHLKILESSSKNKTLESQSAS